MKRLVSSGYRDNLVYRPASEDVLDAEASVEINWLGGPFGYPYVVTRVQSSTVAIGDYFDGYLLYVNDFEREAVLARHEGFYQSDLARLNLTESLNTTDRFRLRLSATGTAPVVVSAFVERWTGSTWTIIGQVVVNDNSGARIATPGSVGFGGDAEAGYTFDNFARNPAP